MDSFTEAYQQLNTAQRQAVDTIDGPVLVLAGPGTGKTQLLSARVANILKQTDTPANTILCLTFTESGAENMRQRLTRFIGQTAYEVNIGTYHAFGGDLIKRYPEYFSGSRQQNPVDELGKRQILQAMTEQMSYTNPLKQTRHHLGDLMSTISELKRALLTPEQLRAIATENLAFITAANQSVKDIFSSFTIMPRTLEKALAFFSPTLAMLQGLRPRTSAAGQYGSLAALATQELETAIAEAESSGKPKPLTEWKNQWLAKDADNHFIFDGVLQNRRLRAMASVLEQYQEILDEQGLYDFDDMILRSITALETHDDLRYSLQEKYLYVLLDEFQDTNAAQLKLIRLLTDNPINEGRPNIMAVGDDDQAIYAFQGAQYSNMLDYYQMYRDVVVVNLTENYRSHGDILTTAMNVAEQIAARLHYHFDGMSKKLDAAKSSHDTSNIERRDFMSPIAEREWVARKIQNLIETGTPPNQIAVLAPKHKYLEPLVPYLNRLDIPVRYERRENILEAPIVEQLITLCRLVYALAQNDQATVNHLWPQVLSYDFWELPTAAIWQTAWKVGDSKETQWSQALLEEATFKIPALLLLGIAGKVSSETAETILDLLIGNASVGTNDPDYSIVRSPLRAYYTRPEMQAAHPEIFYQTVSHLTVLRARLSEYQASEDTALNLGDFLHYVDMYLEAGQQMINTSPYSQQADAVQLLTVFKAKGLEYEHVFLVNCLDEVWGLASRDNGNKLTLPPNLAPIRHVGTTEDERLRILFVALTRARQGLYLTAATSNFSGRPTRRLKYFDEREYGDGGFLAFILPEHVRKIVFDGHDAQAPDLELLELDWRARHIVAMHDVSLQGLLSDRLEHYQISPTHVSDFINLEYAGPRAFYFKTLLRFPQTPIPEAKFGTAIHQTLEWVQHRIGERGSIPPAADVLQQFERRMIVQHMTTGQTRLELERGKRALNLWLAQRAHIMQPEDIAERTFRNDGIFIGDAHVSGQIDRLEIDRVAKTITVVDYKTGKPQSAWKSDAKLLRYRLQLSMYKLLVEHSAAFQGYAVDRGRIEYIEPDETGRLQQLDLLFTDSDIEQARDLLQTVWHHVKSLDFPDISTYDTSITGVKSFIKDLIDGTI